MIDDSAIEQIKKNLDEMKEPHGYPVNRIEEDPLNEDTLEITNDFKEHFGNPPTNNFYEKKNSRQNLPSDNNTEIRGKGSHDSDKFYDTNARNQDRMYASNIKKNFRESGYDQEPMQPQRQDYNQNQHHNQVQQKMQDDEYNYQNYDNISNDYRPENSPPKKQEFEGHGYRQVKHKRDQQIYENNLARINNRIKSEQDRTIVNENEHG